VTETDFAVGIHKSVVTDFYEAGGQHVLQETADELHDLQREGSGAVTVRFFIADEDGAVLPRERCGVRGDLPPSKGQWDSLRQRAGPPRRRAEISSLFVQSRQASACLFLFPRDLMQVYPNITRITW